MRIDAYNHFFPKKYFEKMIEVAGGHKDIGKRVRGVPAIHDLDIRLSFLDADLGLPRVAGSGRP